MKRQKNRFKSKGASMMELVVGMGLITTLAMVGGQLSKYTSDVALMTRIKGNWNGITTTLSERIRYPDLCGVAMGLDPSIPMDTLDPANFNSSRVISLTAPNIQAGDNMNLNVIGPNFPVKIIPLGIQVDSIRLMNPVLVSDPALPANLNRTVSALLVLEGRALNRGLSFPQRRLGIVTLEVTSATPPPPLPANHIVGCRTDQIVGYREMCEKMGCTYDVDLPQPCDCADKPLSACPAWQIPTGVDANGQIICKKWGGLCDAGQLMVGGKLSTDASAPAGQPYCIPDVLWVPPVQTPGSQVEFALATSTGVEGSVHNIQILLPTVQATPVTVTFAMNGGTATNTTDYNYPSTTVAIPAGASSGTIPANLLTDAVSDSGETAIFRLMSVAGGSGLSIGPVNQHTVTIVEGSGTTCPGSWTAQTGSEVIEPDCYWAQKAESDTNPCSSPLASTPGTLGSTCAYAPLGGPPVGNGACTFNYYLCESTTTTVTCPYAGTTENGAGPAALPAGCECALATDVWNATNLSCSAPPPPPGGCIGGGFAYAAAAYPLGADPATEALPDCWPGPHALGTYCKQVHGTNDGSCAPAGVVPCRKPSRCQAGAVPPPWPIAGNTCIVPYASSVTSTDCNNMFGGPPVRSVADMFCAGCGAGLVPGSCKYVSHDGGANHCIMSGTIP